MPMLLDASNQPINIDPVTPYFDSTTFHLHRTTTKLYSQNPMQELVREGHPATQFYKGIPPKDPSVSVREGDNFRLGCLRARFGCLIQTHRKRCWGLEVA